MSFKISLLLPLREVPSIPGDVYAWQHLESTRQSSTVVRNDQSGATDLGRFTSHLCHSLAV